MQNVNHRISKRAKTEKAGLMARCETIDEQIEQHMLNKEIAREIDAAVAEEAERCARIAEAHAYGEVLIRHKMSQVDQVGVVAKTIAAAIRGEDRRVRVGDEFQVSTVHTE